MLKDKTDNHIYENIISKIKLKNDFNISANNKNNNANNNNNNEKIINLIKC